MISKELKKRINEIPEDGEFYKSSTQQGFYQAAKDLIDHGYSEDEAVEFLEGVFNDVSGEYGN